MTTTNFIKPSFQQAIIYAGMALLLGSIIGIVVTQFNNPLFLIIGLFGVAAFAITVISTEFGLLFLVFITYTRFSDIVVHYHNAPSIAKSFIVLLIVAIFTRWAIFHERPNGWQRPSLLIGTYGLVGFISLLYASNTERVILALNDFWKDAIIAIIVVILLQRGVTFRRVIWSLLLAGIFMGTVSVFQFLTKSFTNNYWGFAQANIMEIVVGTDDYRISGPVGDPNFFAQTMLVLVPLALERMLSERGWFLRILASWALAVSALTVIFTYSRGGFLAMTVTVILIFLFYPPRLKSLPLFIIIMVGIVLLIPRSYYERIFTLKEAFQSPTVGFRTRDLAIRGRASENLTAVEMFKDHPFLGVGLNNYSYNYLDYTKKLGISLTARERAAHNLYLEVAAETGILGLIVFFVLIWVTIKTILSARKKFNLVNMNDYFRLTTAFFIGFIGYLSAAIFIHDAYPRYFYLLIGIGLSLNFVADNTITTQEKFL
jgi:O-antigen ligase